MDCRTASMLLQPCFDGALDEGTAAAVRAHIAACTECSREMAALQALRDAIKRSVPRYTAPQSLRDRLKARPQGARVETPRPSPVQQSPARRTPRWLAIAASLLLVAGLSAGLTRSLMVP